jgi:hypothetical protein
MQSELCLKLPPLKNRPMQLLIGYVGFQQAFNGIRSAIRLNEELGDKFIDLQSIMGTTKQKTDAVIESLKNINTRTSLNSLVDFAQRLAGIEGITKIQIQIVLGLAAAFQETGQSAEVSASAATQLLTKIGRDVPKYAALAKINEETFRKPTVPPMFVFL